MCWIIVIIFVFIVVVSFSNQKKQKRAPQQQQVQPPISFKITIQKGPSVSQGDTGSATLKWIGAGGTINAGSFQINDPYTYTSDGVPFNQEASCIDVRLQIGQPIEEGRGALGYWPQYSRITPGQRANYLSWLSCGRKGDLDDIGYVFIYFYGLERRALVDNEDIESVLTQTNSLLSAYSSSRSFFNYASRFIAYILTSKKFENLSRESFEKYLGQSLLEFNDETMAAALAWLFKSNSPLPPNLAFEVARNDIRTSRSVVVTRVADHFRSLFNKKYAERFGDGLLLKAAERERLLDYKPASPTVLPSISHYTLPSVRVPNVQGLSSQFKPIVDIWEECIEELKPVSREIGKGRDVLTRRAYQALPEALKVDIEHPDRDRWERFVAASTSENNIIITTVSNLAILCEFEERPKLTSGQSEELATTAGDVGFVIVPDTRVVGRPYKWGEMVALFRSEGRPDAPTDKKYRAAVLMLEMGMAIASADGSIDQDEIGQIINFLKGQFLLTPNDARRIDAHKEILLKHPPILSNLAKRLQSVLTADHLETVCQFLVSVAAANGTIEKREKSTLRRFYTALGLPASKLDDVIAKLLNAVPEAVEVKRSVTVLGEKIPERLVKPVFKLNTVALQTILQETEQVAQLLGEALSASAEEDAEMIVNDVQRASEQSIGSSQILIKTKDATSPRIFVGLDPRYQGVVAELLLRDVWSPKEFEDLARKYKVMPSGMLEAINTWSDESRGDFLIEEGENYTINKTILEN